MVYKFVEQGTGYVTTAHVQKFPRESEHKLMAMFPISVLNFIHWVIVRVNVIEETL